MNYYSVRVDWDDNILDKLLSFVEYSKFRDVILCEEDYSIREQRSCKRHYHIAISTVLKKGAISARLLNILPTLKRTREESKLYSITVFNSDEKDIRNWRQYHCKGKALGVYNIVRSTFSPEILAEYNKGYWDDRVFFKKSIMVEKKKSLEGLMDYLTENESNFIFLQPHWGKDVRVLNTEKLFDNIVDYYKGRIQYNILELRYNTALYRYSSSTLKDDLKNRFCQYRQFHNKIILKDEKNISTDIIEDYYGDCELEEDLETEVS